MGTATINEWRYYKSGGTQWTTSGSPTSTTLYAGGSYIACIKFTTKSGGYVSNNVKICLNVVRMSGGSTSTNLYCKIGTKAPTTTPQNPYTDSAIGTLGRYTTMSCSGITYNSQQFIHTFDFSQLQPGKTYYLWIYGGNGVQLYAHSYYNAVMYGETSPFAPASVSRETSYHGFYSGSVSFSVTSSTAAYPFVAPVGGSTFYKKSDSAITSGSIIVDQDTSTTDLVKVYYLTMIPGFSQAAYSGSVVGYLPIYAPRFAFKLYDRSSSPVEITSADYNTLPSRDAPSGYSFLGYSSNSSSTSITNSSGASWSASLDNVTRYAVYRKDASSKSITLNANGGSSNVTATMSIAAAYIYGTGATSGGDVTYTNGSYTPSRTGYKFLGWGKTVSQTTSTYSSAQAALDAGYTGTLYAVWQQNSGARVFTSASSSSLYIAYVYNGSSWDYYIPYVHNGSSWQEMG